MLALFSLRLAFGMLACLFLLPARLVHPRFYRTHLLISLGLCCLALAYVYDLGSGPLLGCLGAAVALMFFGSILWHVEGAPGGQALLAVTLVVLAASIWFLETSGHVSPRSGEHLPRAGALGSPTILLGDLTSAALLGTAMSAMLLGHSYLIAPGMPLSPLLRLLGAFAVATMARMAADGFIFWHWSTQHALSSLGPDTLLWLPVRWLVGFALPLGLGWLAWQSARIRSTQSATGILYVVVLFCFLGELTGLLLRDTTGLTM